MEVINSITKSRLILETLRSELAKIAIYDNYNFDVNERFVTLDIEKYTRLAESEKDPILLILPRSTRLYPMSNCQYYTGQTNTPDGWMIDIFAHIHGKTDVDNDSSIILRVEDLLDDLIKRVLSMGTMGLANVLEIYLDSKQSHFDWTKNTGEGILTIKVLNVFSN